MKRSLAILFLLIFSFQVLPVKLLGKLLSTSQNTEEVQADKEDCPDTDSKVPKFNDDQVMLFISFDESARSIALNSKVSAFIHNAESLPSVHVSDILSPPPDGRFI